MRIILTGGGTGGHIYPAIAIAQALKQQHPNAQILFVGSQGGMETILVPQAGFTIETVKLEGWQRKISWQAVRAGWKVIHGGLTTRSILKKFRPDLVIGTGGYVCGPVVLNAALMGIKTIIHEQNALPGITNRFLSRWVDKVMVTFPDSVERFPKSTLNKMKLTGLPIRPAILQIKKDDGIKKIGLEKGKTTILITGGSRGARSINNAMIGVTKALKGNSKVQLLHITGESGYKEHLAKLSSNGLTDKNLGNIIIKPYIHDMHFALAAADLCIARAGATFLSELTALGLPGILIPYPYASENHQEYNARALADNKAAKIILDKNLNEETLLKEIEGLLNNPLELKKMSQACIAMGKPHAINNILEVISETLN